MKSSELRHLIYSELMSKLSHPCREQVDQFCANLGLIYRPFDRKRQKELIFELSLKMRVAPELDKTRQPHGYTVNRNTVEIELARDFGSRLEGVAGFYYANGLWRISLPRLCFFLPYNCGNNQNLMAGFICCPAFEFNQYFLLSSAHKPFGARAVPLDSKTKSLLENFNGKRIRNAADSPRNAA